MTSAPVADPALRVAVLMQRDRLVSRWQRWRWSLLDVMPDAGSEAAADGPPRCLVWTAPQSQWLYPGCEVRLYRDEAQGYHLNLTSPQPSWFVWWTPAADVDCDDPRTDPAGLPAVQAVTLSYDEAGRWMDAGETVEIAPLPAAVANWLAEYATLHYRPEPRRRRRPQSFLDPEQRDVAHASSPAPINEPDDPPARRP